MAAAFAILVACASAQCIQFKAAPLDSADDKGLLLSYLLLSAPSIYNLDRQALIQPVHWPIVQSHLAYQASLGRNGSASGDLNAMTGLPTTTQGWFGGVLTPDGKIYGCPASATTTSVLIVDTRTDTYDITTISGISVTGTGYQGGVLAPNGKIYCAPANTTNNVMIIDPVTNTVDTSTIIHGTTGQYAGGVLAPNGKIFFLPQTNGATEILVVDPATNTFTTISGFTTAANVFSGGVLGPNGKIYAVPAGVAYVGIIDPDTLSVDETTLTFTTGATVAYYGGSLAADGTIHMVAREETAGLIVDPFQHTIDKTSITGLPGAFLHQSAALAPDGLMYYNSLGGGITTTPVINPAAKTFEAASLFSITPVNQFFGIVAAPNGKLYGIPKDAGTVYIIDPKANGRINAKVLTSAYYNKL